jgi:Lon protease-like protein
MLLGSRRGRILNELPAKRSFRQAEIELLGDTQDERDAARVIQLQTELCRGFQQALALPAEATASPVQELLASDLPLGVLTDLVSFALPLSAALKRRLLGECDVLNRAELLLKALGAAPSRTRPTRAFAATEYGPRFSNS